MTASECESCDDSEVDDSDNSSEGDSDGKENPAQDKRLTKGEINNLKDSHIDIHDLKGGKNASKYDLFKDRKGNIKIKPKSGKGPGEPTGLNINDF